MQTLILSLSKAATFGTGLVERYRKLDDAPTEIFMESRGDNTDKVAEKFEKEAKLNPQDKNAQSKAEEADRLRHPIEDTPNA